MVDIKDSMIKHKSWNIDEKITGRFKNGKPTIGTIIQNGLNDIEPDGSFVPCDTRISEINRGVTHLKMNRGRMGELRFGDSSHPNNFLVKIKNKRLKGVSFKYTGAYGESMTANNGKPLCHFDNGISIESTPYYKGVKMDIIINEPLTAPLEYPFSVKTYGQDYAFIEEKGGVTLRGEDQEDYFIKPPYAIDANGDIGPVTIHYTGVVNKLITFKKVVDETWLRQAAAPVRIDPDVTIEDGVAGGVIKDAGMLGTVPGSNYGAYIYNPIKTSLAGTQQNFAIYVDLSAYTDITITSAKYIFEVVFWQGSIQTFEVNPSLRAWGEGIHVGGTPSTGELTFNSARHNQQAWTTGGGYGADTDYDSFISDVCSWPPGLGSFDVNLSVESVQSKIDSPSTNYGDIFRPNIFATGALFRFASNEHATAARPQLYFEYTDAVVGGRRRKITQMRQLRK